jgi:hypothetical protein
MFLEHYKKMNMVEGEITDKALTKFQELTGIEAAYTENKVVKTGSYATIQ